MSNELNAIRNIYRDARNGIAINPMALVAAVGLCIATGIDVDPALRAFEPFAFVRIDCVRGVDAAMLCRVAREFGGWKAAIRMSSLLGGTDVWAAAMTANYGPTGTHPSRCDAEGRPTAETLDECPEVAQRMAEATERWERLLGWYERNDGATRWEHVVEMRRVSST